MILDFTIAYLQKNGFNIPLLFTDKAGLGLHVPSPNFSVHDVRTCVGNYYNSNIYKKITFFLIHKMSNLDINSIIT